MTDLTRARLDRRAAMQLRYRELNDALDAALWNGEIYGDYLFELQRQAIDLAAEFYAEFGSRIAEETNAMDQRKRGAS